MKVMIKTLIIVLLQIAVLAGPTISNQQIVGSIKKMKTEFWKQTKDLLEWTPSVIESVVGSLGTETEQIRDFLKQESCQI